MKITWFGDNVFRLYVGGQIVVTDSRKAPAHINAHELTAGADVLVEVAEELPGLNPYTKTDWQRRKRKSMLDTDEAANAPVLFGISGQALVLDSADEDRLIVGFGPVEWDRFADGAILVLTRTKDAKLALEKARPKLIALALSDVVDEQFQALAFDCGDCALQVLERGFALEA